MATIRKKKSERWQAKSFATKREASTWNCGVLAVANSDLKKRVDHI